MIRCYFTGGHSSPRIAGVFARGAWALGLEAKISRSTSLLSGEVAMFGSAEQWGIVTRALEIGRTLYYADHGYFGRGHFYRITRDGFQHTGEGEGNEARLKALGVHPRKWRRSGRHIVVCPPDWAWGRLVNINPDAWLARVLATLNAHTDRPILVRDRQTRRPLAADLESAHALVTNHSNAAVEALIAGVPVFVTAPCAARVMAEIDLTRIENPRRPSGRLGWASVLAANQWTLEEIARGDALAHLRPDLARARAV